MLDKTLYSIRKIIPTKVFNFFNPAYHWTLSLCSAIYYGFPSRHIKVIAVTGTKGKSSTTEILNAILEKSGYKTALSNTIRYKIGNQSNRNLSKMSTPGRFFLQRLIRQAVDANCRYLILEMTSQGALLYRHRFIELDTLIFTNLTPEHIEAHGSYENYLNSKLSIARNMENSRKPVKTIITNSDDKESQQFLACKADKKITFGIKDVEPFTLSNSGIDFTFAGKNIHTNLQGQFNLYNILGAISCAKEEKVSDQVIIDAIENLSVIPGRLEKFQAKNFTVIVDYAHTVDSLKKIYEVFKTSPMIGVLGGTGGGAG
jgi:UDP-N-acetylmuramyl tripeptide synthase